MNLFIIGNGFDIQHGLKTKYTDFAKYLKINNSDLYDNICKIYGNLPDEEILWNNFEETMERIDEDIVRIDTNFDLEYNDPYDENLKILVEDKIKNKLKDISESLFEYFEKWVGSINTKGIKKLTSKIRGLDEENEDLFLTFNYNLLLEESYNVDSFQVCHIHNSINQGNLILGHGNKLKIEELKNEVSIVNENKYDENDEEKYESVEDLEEVLSLEENLEYYIATYKDTENIIVSHREFFKSLKEVENIYIIGHSFGLVDFPYFKEISKNVSLETKWFIYYYSDEDRKKALELTKLLRIKTKILESSKFFNL